ncbi:MAG: Holliday junction branch migration DNA helicase RuvB [Acidobacteria bacterium]|nr:MAG: Holliday junction branch migration DNA helicase RuvB [Acidobacteriota bacterium]
MGEGARERIVAGEPLAEELRVEADLRPRRLDQYVGQQRLKDNLAVYLEAARRRRRPLDHVLFAGPPGLGKTTLAHVIAGELGANLRTTSGPAIERAGDLAALLTHLEPGDVLFIDEIHRLGTAVEEVLYPAMEDFALDLTIGQGPGARSVRVELPPFTLVGATTRSGLLSAPLRDRFGIVERLEFYPPEDLVRILFRASERLGVEIEEEAAEEIARRSRGTPRVALRLLRRLRDFADVRGGGRLGIDVARDALERLGIDEMGLDALDRRFLRVIVDHHRGGPVGLNTLAASLGEEPDTLEEVVEPYLIQIGFIERTPRGRVATARAAAHVGAPGGPDRLF